MGDIKLYAIAGKKVHELAGQSLAVEKSLQTMIERNLLAVLGVHFLARNIPPDGNTAGALTRSVLTKTAVR